MKQYCLYFRRLVEVIAVSSLVAGCAQQGVNMVGKELEVSGDWECSYTYFPAGHSKNPFKMNILKADHSRIEGITVEPRTSFGPQDKKELDAQFAGSLDLANGTFEFRKIYTYSKEHSVWYSGRFSSPENMSGIWRTKIDWSGDWSCNKAHR